MYTIELTKEQRDVMRALMTAAALAYTTADKSTFTAQEIKDGESLRALRDVVQPQLRRPQRGLVRAIEHAIGMIACGEFNAAAAYLQRRISTRRAS